MAIGNLADMINKAMVVEVAEYGDRACQEFYKQLKEGNFKTTKCNSCSEIYFPPREFCPACFKTDVEWVDMPKKGSLYGFTQQERSLRFGKPDVIGVVELEGVGRFLTRIDAAYEDLEIGMEVEFAPLPISDEQTLHQFKPVK